VAVTAASRWSLASQLLSLCVPLFVSVGVAHAETLYNGIVLPAPWPPQRASLPDPLPPPPYLVSPPPVIPIDVGRQLFVDDFLVEQTDMTRTYHRPEYYAGNPVFSPDKKWEGNWAIPFSHGIWHDPADRLFKMWYAGDLRRKMCYATSGDGIQWTKPALDVVPGTNVLNETTRDSCVVWLDHNATDPRRRFKFAAWSEGGSGRVMTIRTSPDGIHWSEPLARVGDQLIGDRTTLFYNPFRARWVWSVRHSNPARMRKYLETTDLSTWTSAPTQFVNWIQSDNLDAPDPAIGVPCQLYNLDCVAYESLIVGLFAIWHGEKKSLNRPKLNSLCVGFTRDGFHWYRPVRTPFIPYSNQAGAWNFGNVQSVGGCFLVVGDTLRFYVSGRQGGVNVPDGGICRTGLATMRRDGFASMDAGSEERTLTTRKVRFGGKYLFVNAAASTGSVRVEVLDGNGQVIAPFSKENCDAIRADKTLAAVSWKGADDLSAVAGKDVRFRFHLTNGSLYAFWVSPDKSGASYGYVAAGGPGFTEPRDMPDR